VDLDEVLAATFSLIAPHLTERQRRLLFGAAARALGYGGVSRVARLAEASRPTVRRGAAELDQPADPRGRIRQHEGPKRRRVTDPGLLGALDRLVDPDTRGDPQSPLRWTCKSTRELAEMLTAQGHPVSDDTVGRLLREQGYRLQRTLKTLEGARHPDRDAQFRYLNEQARAHLGAGQPVVSVDTKKKELVGRFANGGAEWQPTGEPEQVNVHDFPDPALGKAIPYGVYDLGRNSGWVGVGVDHDTAAFAVQTLRRWWQQVGSHTYPRAERLLVCADADGSNGYRVRAWKTELARLAVEDRLLTRVLDERDKALEQAIDFIHQAAERWHHRLTYKNLRLAERASSRRQIARVPGGQVCRSIQPVSSTTSAPLRGWPSGSTAGVQAGSGWAAIASRRWASICIPTENPTPRSRKCQASRVLAPALSLRTRTGWSPAAAGSCSSARSTKAIRSSAAPGAALPGRSSPASGSPGASPRSK
jgi:hypothetical protein